MEKTEILKELKQHGMSFVHKHFDKLEKDQQKELLKTALYVILNNQKFNEYLNELKENLYY
jgi:predicted nucleotidyltransferase